MNARVKQMWVDALPNYKQGTGALRHDDEFCCLGVLCDLHRIETGKEWWICEGTQHAEVRYTYLGCAGSLPAAVVEWAELNSPNPTVNGPELEGLCSSAHYKLSVVQRLRQPHLH